jgi:hypothetical protein
MTHAFNWLLIAALITVALVWSALFIHRLFRDLRNMGVIKEAYQPDPDEHDEHFNHRAQTFCEKSIDGVHCEHWQDGDACCYCNDPKLSDKETKENKENNNDTSIAGSTERADRPTGSNLQSGPTGVCQTSGAGQSGQYQTDNLSLATDLGGKSPSIPHWATLGTTSYFLHALPTDQTLDEGTEH